MKTIKIIDLLVDIANEKEVPKKIKWEDTIYAYSEYDKDYLEYPFSDEEYKGLFDMRDNILTQFLNDEVEIIEDTPKEDKKIAKLDLRKKDDGFLYLHGNIIVNQDFAFANKINEIIDKLNEMSDKELRDKLLDYIGE